MQNDEVHSSDKKASHFQKYFQYALSIISSYKGNEPFHLFIKKYFSFNKKHGSRDRKIITALCYNYFRVGITVSNINFEENFLLSTFLCEIKPSPMLEYYKPGWNSLITQPLNDKLKLVEKEFDIQKIFPFGDELSNEINLQKFSISFLIQPKLFIRIRPEYINSVLAKIKKIGFYFERLGENCVAFSNNEKVNTILEIDKEAVIQDYNSQQVGDFIASYLPVRQAGIVHHTSNISIWDCCSGSGGKSILAYDILKNVQLTVTDIRKNILSNLKKRFAKASIKNYHSFVADISDLSSIKKIKERPDLIIADVPCSGSGTWARTPERLFFFNKNEIEKFASLQKKIIENIVPVLKKNGYLLYITCSVFKKENEENAFFIQQNLQLNLIEMKYLKGYEMQADTLFAALFKKFK